MIATPVAVEPPVRREAPADTFTRASGPVVEYCRAPVAMLPAPISRALGLDHWWLRVGDVESGQWIDFSTLNPADTAMVDHHGEGDRPDAVCEPVSRLSHRYDAVDRECVLERMRFGRPLGIYLLDGVCYEHVFEILDACSR